MLKIRPFRNEDPPRLLELWKKTQQRQGASLPLFSLSLNQFQTQILGPPMLDNRSVMLAFEEDTLVGYVHATLAPTSDGSSFDPTTGQICFLCVDTQCRDVPGVTTALIRAAENYLLELGTQTIFGGSPSPSAPFYTAFYGGGEAVGILHSDKAIIDAFLEANYQVHQKTVRFHLDLLDYSSVITAETVKYYAEYDIEINEVSKAKTWWEGCSLAHGIWFDTIAYPVQMNRPIARLRTRITYPDTENVLTMYGGTWFASLIELRVHPDFNDKGIKGHLLRELVRYLIAQNQVVLAEAHAAEDSLLFALLRSQSWQERDSGCVFVKKM